MGFFNLFDILFPILFLAVFGLAVGTIVSNLAKQAKTNRNNNASPRLTSDATVVAKRTHVWGDHSHTDYYATFQFESGDRLELVGQLPRFLARPDLWTIVPESVARTLQNEPGLRRCEMDFTPPFRPLYLQCRRSALSTLPVQNFLDTLREVLTEQQFPGLLL